MKDQDRMNPLRRVDDATAKQISEQYPADWDMDVYDQIVALGEEVLANKS